MGTVFVANVIETNSEFVKFDIVTINGVKAQGVILLQVKSSLLISGAQAFVIGSQHTWTWN